MVQANTLDVSRFQDPKEFPYKEAKEAGIERLIIQESHGLTEDKYVKQHIANAKKYGLEWHLYHLWENQNGESTYALQHAKDLGLTSDQFFFLDMEGDLPANWNDQFTGFRNTIKSSFRVGLYCSEDPYDSKFNDEEIKSLGVTRWIANYSREPKNYDIWQISGAGSGGFGSYTKDIDRDYAKPNVFSVSKPDKPKPKPTPMTEMYRPIILDQGYDTETGVFGLICSADNGKTTKIYFTPYGIVWHADDVDVLWNNFLKDKVKAVQSGSLSVSWDDIQNKPDVALKSEIPDTSKFVTYDEIPTMPDMSRYALKSQIPSVTGLVKEAELDNYVKKDDLTNLNLDGYVKVSDLIDYAKKSDIPQSMTWNQITGKPNVATKDDVSYLKSLIGSSSSGDAGLSIEAITELIKHHLKASVNAQTGNLEISVDDVSNGSIADAVATKVAQSLTFTMQGNELVVQIGGTE